MVEPRRNIGVGTLILSFVTFGLSLLLIPFYPQRCPICKTSSLSETNPTTSSSPAGRHFITWCDKCEYNDPKYDIDEYCADCDGTSNFVEK